jgi:HEAT repeat protein
LRLLDGAEEPLIRKLIPLLREMEGQAVAELLFELTRHPSDPVRRDAIQALFSMDQENLRRLFPLIGDPQPSVRGLILGHLGMKRNPLAEELLLNYLEKGRVHIKDRQHILACYRALGRCGSPRSLPFLRDSLLKQDWKAFLGIGDTLQRQGAALALLGMPDEADVKMALERASRSLFSGVRSSYRRAVEEEERKRRRGGRR